MSNDLEIATGESAAWLDEQETAIRFHGSRAVSDVIEVGRRLEGVKKHLGHGNWLPWLERRFKWSEDTAESLIAIFRLHRQIPGGVRNLALPLSGLYLLARHTTPPEAVEAVITKAEDGERVSVAEVKATIQEAKAKRKPRLPSYIPTVAPKPAPELVREPSRKVHLGRAAIAKSKEHLQWFTVACRQYLPDVTVEEHRQEARHLSLN